MASGNDCDVSVNVPVFWTPIEFPNHPGPSMVFIPKKKAIAAARMYVKILMPSS